MTKISAAHIIELARAQGVQLHRFVTRGKLADPDPICCPVTVLGKSLGYDFNKYEHSIIARDLDIELSQLQSLECGFEDDLSYINDVDDLSTAYYEVGAQVYQLACANKETNGVSP